MSDNLTPREVAARRLLGLRALKTLIEAEETKARAEAMVAFNRAGQREVAELPDGTPLGNVRLDPGKGSWKVTNAGAWLDYVVNSGHEQHVVERTTTDVSPAYTEAVLKDLVPGSETFVNQITGELTEAPPGITYTPASPGLKVTGDKGAPEAVRALLGAQGAALGLREVEA